MQTHAKTASEVFEQVSTSVVVVYGFDDNNEITRTGSGVVLPGGSIATNCHVLEDATQYAVRHRKEFYLANSGQADTKRDVCILIPTGLNAPPATFRNTYDLRVGTRVYAIGSPEGLELTLSEGIVSGLRETEEGRYIQTTAPISHGSSGGGLFDDEGRLIGLPTFYLRGGQQLNFAVPVEWIEQLLKAPNNSFDSPTSTGVLDEGMPVEEEDSAQNTFDERATEEARQAEREALLREAKRRQDEVSRVVERYRGLIGAKVRGNTRLPDNFSGNPEVRSVVWLLPTGDVLRIQVTQSSGNLAYDQAVVRALEKSSPLPLPDDRDARAAFVPELTFVHRPRSGEAVPPQAHTATTELLPQNTDEHHRATMQSQSPAERPIAMQTQPSTEPARVIEERFREGRMKVNSPTSICELPLMFAGFDRKPIPKGLDSINATAASLPGETPPRHRPGNLAPRYPLQAVTLRSEGRALVRAEIMTDGLVGQIWIKQSSGAQVLDLAALDTVRKWSFFPAQRNGIAVPMWLDVPIEYKLP